MNKVIETEEISRIAELLPDAVRGDAETFIKLLEDYYRFLNTESGPNAQLNNLVNEHDLFKITSDQYLNSIQAAIASYVPPSTSLDRATLYQRLVGYYSPEAGRRSFYTNRGARESAPIFFRVFFDTFCEIHDPVPDSQISNIPDAEADSQNQEHWRPYSYKLKTDVPYLDWIYPYKALVHPLGFRIFAVLLFILISRNCWDRVEETKFVTWDFDSTVNTVNSWFEKPPCGGGHSPNLQPGWINIERLLSLFVETQLGHYGRTKFDIDRFLKLYDPTPVLDYGRYSNASVYPIETDHIYKDVYTNIGTSMSRYEGGFPRGPVDISVFLSTIFGEAQYTDYIAFAVREDSQGNVGSYPKWPFAFQDMAVHGLYYYHGRESTCTVDDEKVMRYGATYGDSQGQVHLDVISGTDLWVPCSTGYEDHPNFTSTVGGYGDAVNVSIFYNADYSDFGFDTILSSSHVPDSQAEYEVTVGEPAAFSMGSYTAYLDGYRYYGRTLHRKRKMDADLYSAIESGVIDLDGDSQEFRWNDRAITDFMPSVELTDSRATSERAGADGLTLYSHTKLSDTPATMMTFKAVAGQVTVQYPGDSNYFGRVTLVFTTGTLVIEFKPTTTGTVTIVVDCPVPFGEDRSEFVSATAEEIASSFGISVNPVKGNYETVIMGPPKITNGKLWVINEHHVGNFDFTTGRYDLYIDGDLKPIVVEDTPRDGTPVDALYTNDTKPAFP